MDDLYKENNLIDIKIERQYTPTGKISSVWTGYIRHKGLEIEKKFVDGNDNLLRSRLEKQAKLWQAEWWAKQETAKVKNTFDGLNKILASGVSEDLNLSWDQIRDKAEFPQQKPQFNEKKPVLQDFSPKPNFRDKLINIFIRTWTEDKLLKQKENYTWAMDQWKENKIKLENNLAKWQKDKKLYIKNQEKFNAKIDQTKTEYYENKANGIEKYYKFLLESSKYPLSFPKKFLCQYKKNNRILIIEYFLPDLFEIPEAKEVKFIKSTNEFIKVKIPEPQLRVIYDFVIYQITLRTIFEVFKYDLIHAIDMVVFNGWVNTLNQATGNRQNVCILSIEAKRDEFMSINFKNVDPRVCFKSLRGIAATRLSSLAPIAPILNIDKKDKRFIQEREIVDNLDDSANIAAMNWQDFEHLVRELFEKEYQNIGGEVKVTQSSRDKGVDAVIFDPDPIRGGKIILQAKRYTNTVKIESVRALYGVMQDEGAMKGILIATSDFGADAYDFAKDKPITLLSGNNLLAMLQKYGYKARVDLKEAKEILEERGEI